MQGISPVRAVARQSVDGFALRCSQRLTASQSDRYEHHQYDHEGLDGADPGDTARGAEGRGLVASHRAAPADERDHRPDLQREHEEKQSHLHMEEGVLEIVRGGLFRTEENSSEPRGEPQHGRDPPPRVGRERSTDRGAVDDASERTAACPDCAKADSKAEQMHSGEQKTQHAVAPGASGSRNKPGNHTSPTQEGQCVNTLVAHRESRGHVEKQAFFCHRQEVAHARHDALHRS